MKDDSREGERRGREKGREGRGERTGRGREREGGARKGERERDGGEREVGGRGGEKWRREWQRERWRKVREKERWRREWETESGRQIWGGGGGGMAETERDGGRDRFLFRRHSKGRQLMYVCGSSRIWKVCDQIMWCRKIMSVWLCCYIYFLECRRRWDRLYFGRKQQPLLASRRILPGWWEGGGGGGGGGKSVQDDVVKTAIPCFPFRVLILFSVTRLFSEHRCEHEELLFFVFVLFVFRPRERRSPSLSSSSSLSDREGSYVRRRALCVHGMFLPPNRLWNTVQCLCGWQQWTCLPSSSFSVREGPYVLRALCVGIFPHWPPLEHSSVLTTVDASLTVFIKRWGRPVCAATRHVCTWGVSPPVTAFRTVLVWLTAVDVPPIVIIKRSGRPVCAAARRVCGWDISPATDSFSARVADNSGRASSCWGFCESSAAAFVGVLPQLEPGGTLGAGCDFWVCGSFHASCWHGTQWAVRELKTWHGTQWAVRELRTWHGTRWAVRELRTLHGTQWAVRELRTWHGTRWAVRELRTWHGTRWAVRELRTWHSVGC